MLQVGPDCPQSEPERGQPKPHPKLSFPTLLHVASPFSPAVLGIARREPTWAAPVGGGSEC